MAIINHTIIKLHYMAKILNSTDSLTKGGQQCCYSNHLSKENLSATLSKILWKDKKSSQQNIIIFKVSICFCIEIFQ